jgi:hypothetical protein
MHPRPIWAGEMTPAEYRVKRRADKRAEYRRHKDKYAVYQKTNYEKKKEEIRMQQKSYYQRNKEKVKAAAKQYALSNKEKIREREKARRARNPSAYHAYFVKRKYGITIEQYNQMLADQKGICATPNCMNDGSEDKRRRRLFVDHCHTTGKVRGLLCCTCNRVLGMLKESPPLIRGLADYIERTNAR